MKIRSLAKNSILWLGSISFHNYKSKIVFYHDVFKDQSYKSLDSDVLMGTSLDMFKEHLKEIEKEHFTIVPKITKTEGEVCIMLDDGFRGIWDNREFFYENKLRPTVFLAVDLIGKEGFLTPDEILELQEHGFIFECHSWSHTNLVEKTDEELEHELLDSKEYLSNLLKKDVTEICLPIGYFSQHLIKKCKDYGYKEIYSSIPGCYYDTIHDILRTRNLCQFASPFEVRLLLRGGGEILKGRYEQMHNLSNK